MPLSKLADVAEETVRFLALFSRDMEVFTSAHTIAECTHVNDPAKLEAAKPFFMGLLASGKSGIRLIQTTISVVERGHGATPVA